MHANSTDRRPRAGTTGRPAPARPPRRRRRRAAAGVAVLAVAGVAACGTAPAGDGEAAPATFSRAKGAALGYQEPVADVSDLVGPAGEDDPRWTVVGSVFEPDAGRSLATVWTSEDGRDWTRHRPGSPSGRDEAMAAETRTSDGIVAVGRVGSGDDADAALWERTGDEWTRTTPDALGGDHEQWAFDVASGPGGIVVAGGENVWGDVRARLWFSADGATWASVDGGPGGPFDTTGEETARSVAAVGDGFVAVGGRLLDNDQDGIAWYSADGQAWEQLDVPTMGGRGRQEIVSVATVGDGVVAGGMSDLDGDGLGDPVVWRSADGRDWSAPSGALPMTDERRGAEDRLVRSISSTEADGLIAAGGNAWRPRLWRSTDAGATWSEMPDPVHGDLFQDGVDLRAAAVSGPVAVAVGAEPTVLRLQGRRWEDATGDSFPKGGAQPFTTAVATRGDGERMAGGGLITAASGETRERLAGQLWRRTGGGWKAVDSDALAAGQVLDVAPLGDGFVAVGVEDFGLASQRETLTDALPDGLVWLSPNGRDWARVGVADARVNAEYLQFLDNPSPDYAPVIAEIEREAPPVSVTPAGGDGTRSLEAVVPFGDGFLAVGSVYVPDNADPIIVHSTDGKAIAAETPPHSGPGTQVYRDVCSDGRVAVAAGVGGAPDAYDVLAAARTDAGWTKGSGPFTGAGDQQAAACGASEDGFVIVGSEDGNGNRDARVWVSPDGVEWTEIESSALGGPGDQEATAVAPVPGGGWLVAGADRSSGDGDVALWRIDESGEVTRRDRGERALRGPGEQAVSAVAIDEDGHVTLVGKDYGRAGVWESSRVDR